MAHTLTTAADDLTAQRDVDELLLIQRAAPHVFTAAAPNLTLTTEAHTEATMADEVPVGSIARNELPDPARFIFENADGTRRDLTGATAEAYLRKPDGTVRSWLPMTLTDPANGEAEYAWAEGDTDTADIGGVGTKLAAVVTLNGRRHFSDVMVLEVVDTYASHESFAAL